MRVICVVAPKFKQARARFAIVFIATEAEREVSIVSARATEWLRSSSGVVGKDKQPAKRTRAAPEAKVERTAISNRQKFALRLTRNGGTIATILGTNYAAG